MSNLISRRDVPDTNVGDMISRQKILRAFEEMCSCTDYGWDERDFRDLIKKMPSAEPERKKGKWIATYSDCGGDVWVSWKCSNCGYVRKKGWKYTDDGKKPDALFCEMCNADMRGEQDDTD